MEFHFGLNRKGDEIAINCSTGEVAAISETAHLENSLSMCVD